MMAREKFQYGDKVQYSALWLALPEKRQRPMTVVGFGRTPELVRVKYDGLYVSVYSYHMVFIERREDATAVGAVDPVDEGSTA